MVLHEARARKMAKAIIKMGDVLREEPCLSMSKNASPEQKKEIEDFHTKKIIAQIKKHGIEKVEVQFKLVIKFFKLMNEFSKKANKTKKAKKIEKNVTCKYNKKTASYTTIHH